MAAQEQAMDVCSESTFGAQAEASGSEKQAKNFEIKKVQSTVCVSLVMAVSTQFEQTYM